MKMLDFDFSTRIAFSEPVHDHYFVLRCLPRTSSVLRVHSAEVVTDPICHLSKQTDGLGNTLSVGSLVGDHDHFEYGSHGTVEIDLTCAKAEEPHALFRYPSSLTRPDEGIESFAREAFGTITSADASLCTEIMHAVHKEMEYVPGSTNVHTTAAEAFSKRSGVCQDFAHITISIMRLMGVPVRYVSGLAYGEGETHAWVEANIGGFWHGFDPTRDQLVNEEYIPLAVGRDWSDCPIESGSFIGLANQTQIVNMVVKEHEEQ